MREAARKTREATSACGNGKRGAGAALWEYQYGGGPVDHEKRRVGTPSVAGERDRDCSSITNPQTASDIPGHI